MFQELKLSTHSLPINLIFEVDKKILLTLKVLIEFKLYKLYIKFVFELLKFK